MFKRSSGILMHITSLPSEYGIGDFGKKAYEFVDFLERSEQKLWQILPMGSTGYGDSPYQSFSAFAGNPYFIDLEEFIELGYIDDKDLLPLREINYENNLDYEQVNERKTKLLKNIFEIFLKKIEKNGEIEEELKRFKEKNAYWLDNYVLYMALKEKFSGKSWQNWPKCYKYRNLKKIEKNDENLKKNMDYFSFVQYTFYKQWFRLKSYANSKGISIIGDIPIFVATDSADTWSESKIFQFDKYKKPKRVSGCPPDYFSKDGQLWGNVLYDWKYLKKTNYHWWIKRIAYCFEIYDIIRIDHFRGFEAYWSIPARDTTAVRGHWEKGPGMDFFRTIERRLGKLPIIAEDLGLLTEKVKKLLKRSDFPGMKVLEFAFDSEDSDYLPHKYEENCVAYTGTHDNNTVVGWYETIPLATKHYCDEYLKNYLNKFGSDYWLPINLRFIDAIWASKANIAIAQMQDFIGLGEEGRMNTPSTLGKNWKWRLNEKYITDELCNNIKITTRKFKR